MRLSSKLCLFLSQLFCMAVICYFGMLTNIAHAQQTLRIGTGFYYPPYVVTTKKQSFGFEIDYMRAICKIMDTNCIFVAMTFDKLFAALRQGDIDLAIDTITITPERQQQFLFSYPYLLSHGVLLVNSNSSIKDQQQLSHKTIGVQTDTVFPPILIKQYDGAVSIKSYEAAADVIEALQNHKVDAIILDYHAARYWQAQSDGLLRILGPKIEVGYGTGIMTNKNNQDLITSINQAILILEDNGTFIQLYNQYFSN